MLMNTSGVAGAASSACAAPASTSGAASATAGPASRNLSAAALQVAGVWRAGPQCRVGCARAQHRGTRVQSRTLLCLWQPAALTDGVQSTVSC